MDKVVVSKEFFNEAQVDYILANFDFHKVVTTMEHLDWHWHGSDRSPTIEELRDVARDLLTRVLEPDGSGFISTGGFTVRYEDECLFLEFIIEEANNVGQVECEEQRKFGKENLLIE